jgi:transposase
MGWDEQSPSLWPLVRPMNCRMPSRSSTVYPVCPRGWSAWVVGDRGYASHAFRQPIWECGARPAIPSKRNEAPVTCPDWIYNNRNQVERLWARLKEWRAVATRYQKTASSFIGVLHLAATLDWLKS